MLVDEDFSKNNNSRKNADLVLDFEVLFIMQLKIKIY